MAPTDYGDIMLAKRSILLVGTHAAALALTGAYLTREVTPEQINAKAATEGDALCRFGEVREINQESRTVELAFSSETPVERWFGEEVLDHGPGAMRMARVEGGAALLVDHDWRDQVGVVEKVWVGDDRRGRATVRFGKSARASEIFDDVIDGIRKHVSIGYRVHKVEIEKRKGAADLVRVTDWEPYEISLVAVPADPTVGVGRTLERQRGDADIEAAKAANQQSQEGAASMKWRNYIDAQGNKVRCQVGEDGKDIAGTVEILERAAPEGQNEVRGGDVNADRQRVRSILDTGEKFKAQWSGAPDLARDFAAEGRSADEFRKALLEKMNEQRAPALGDETGNIGLTEKEARGYSFMRALRAMAFPEDKAAREAAAFELEASRAAADKAQRSPKGILIPTDVLVRGLMPKEGTRAMTTGTTSGGDTGGYTIATDLLSASFVDLLRNRSTIMQLGTTMGGLVGNVDIPRQAGGATGYWLGEDEEATLSAMSFDQIGMSPKTVAGMLEWTRKLMMQSSMDIEALARRDIATALALSIDRAGYYGSGSSNQPRGIANYAGINAVDFGTDGGGAGTGQMPTYAEIVQMETEVAADNADVNSMAYALNARMRGHLKTTQKFAGTDGAPVWEPGNTVNGYRTEVTNQIDNGDTFFGNFGDALIGLWGGLDITVDPFTHSARGRIRLVAMQDCDFVLRRMESFCLGRDSTA